MDGAADATHANQMAMHVSILAVIIAEGAWTSLMAGAKARALLIAALPTSS